MKPLNISLILFIATFSCISCSFMGNITSTNQNSKNIKPCECEDNTTERTCHSRYKPVCGCDSITYDNACLARKNGLKDWTKGACK